MSLFQWQPFKLPVSHKLPRSHSFIQLLPLISCRGAADVITFHHKRGGNWLWDSASSLNVFMVEVDRWQNGSRWLWSRMSGSSIQCSSHGGRDCYSRQCACLRAWEIDMGSCDFAEMIWPFFLLIGTDCREDPKGSQSLPQTRDTGTVASVRLGTAQRLSNAVCVMSGKAHQHVQLQYNKVACETISEDRVLAGQQNNQDVPGSLAQCLSWLPSK